MKYPTNTYSCTGPNCVLPPNSFVPPIGCGQISTADRFFFTYGRVEIRARLPDADWMFPQLWLQPIDPEAYGGQNYASGLMRVAYATPGEILQGGVLLGADSPFRLLGTCFARGRRARDTIRWEGEFHMYSLEWRPGEYGVIH